MIKGKMLFIFIEYCFRLDKVLTDKINVVDQHTLDVYTFKFDFIEKSKMILKSGTQSNAKGKSNIPRFTSYTFSLKNYKK